MSWLARQPFSLIAMVAVGWIVLMPTLVRSLFRAVLWIAARHTSAIAVSVQVYWPTKVVALGAPPVLLIAAWWAARRRGSR